MYVERLGESGATVVLVHGSVTPGWATWDAQRPLAAATGSWSRIAAGTAAWVHRLGPARVRRDTAVCLTHFDPRDP